MSSAEQDHPGFLSDIYLPQMLYAATVRSPFAAATIARIESSSLPPEITVVTSRDIPGRNALVILNETMPLLADRETCYAGQPVCLLAGPTQREVVRAARHLEVEYHEQSASFAFEDANDAEVISLRSASRGDATGTLAAGSSQIEGVYRTGIQEHLYNEPNGAVAIHTDEGLLIRSATQWPFHVRDTVANALAVKPAEIIVRPSDSGIALDGKLWYPSLVAAHCALLAQKSGKDVKLVYSNTEDFCFSTKRAPFTISIASCLGNDGALQAASIDIRYNAGAYPLFTEEISPRLIATAAAQYECPHLEVTVATVRTNLPPLNVQSGFGGASLQFAVETHLDRISELSSRSPVAWRVDHLARQTTPRGKRVTQHRGRYERVLGLVSDRSDFARKHGSYALQRNRRDADDVRRPAGGIGVALGTVGNGLMPATEAAIAGSVSVRLESEGTAILRTSCLADPHLSTAWRTRIADALSLEPDSVAIRNTDTAAAPDSGPSTLSRDLVIVSQLIDQACATIQKRRFRAPLPIEVKKTYRPPRAPSFLEESMRGVPFAAPAIGAAVVEVSVDPVTFESRVGNVWIAVDAGTVLDAMEARRALEMSVNQALEWAMHEIVRYRDGIIDPRSYLSYRTISEPGLASISVDVLESDTKSAYGIVDLPAAIVPAALAAAVSQATGRYMDRIPTNPGLIHDYMEPI